MKLASVLLAILIAAAPALVSAQEDAGVSTNSIPTDSSALKAPDSGAAAPSDHRASIRASLSKEIAENSLLSGKTKEFVGSVLVNLCFDEIFVSAVKARNASGMTLGEIQKIDEEWKAAEDELAIQTELLGNDCASRIKTISASNKAIVEAFVMDNQGANVGQNTLTSDFWQGDEDKWKNSYKGGAGGLDVGKVTFDKSANAQLQQVSLPIYDADGKVIGAVTWGLNIDSL